MKAVFASNVLIDYLQGVPEARAEIARYREPLDSVISWMEVLCGAATDEEEAAARALFASMSCIGVNREVAALAVEERRRLALKPPDAIILATADHMGCILVTRNTRDFDAGDPRIRIPCTLASG